MSITEEAANNVGGGAIAMNPTGKSAKIFDVEGPAFQRVGAGKVKRSHWRKYLGTDNPELKDHFKTHGQVVVRCKETGAMRVIRARGT